MSAPFALDDRYTRTEGRIAITGLQALVRLPIEQNRLDRQAGLRIGSFITGYQGSPLGEYDKQLARAARHLHAHDVFWQAGINEEIAATALYGTQLLELFPHQRYDGVVAIWYGKSPGVDRTGDAFRHANFMGTSRYGAGLALAGDDIACKSSTIPGDSTIAFYDLMFPLLYPGDPAEVLELGRHGIAMSRYCGLWSALKIVTNVADGGGVTQVTPPVAPRIPELEIEGKPFQKQLDHRLLPPYSVELERQMNYERSVAALAYARENQLDRVTVRSGSDRLGLIAAGKTYRDLIHALDLIGLDTDALRSAGIRLYKLGMIAPLEPEGLRAFAEGLEEVVVVEEKRGFVETLVRDGLYGLASQPRVFGKRDARGEVLFASHSELNPDQIAIALARHLAERLRWPELNERAAPLRAIAERRYDAVSARTPYYCSGCPHNRSTALPEGEEHVGGGIGCAAMAVWMDRGVTWLAQMGGDGASWIGLSRFTEKRHIFQNVGDGTFAHSASKALEACVSADVDITFRILFNRAVAMTGGQDVVGLGTPSALARQLEAQGVKRIDIVAEDPSRYSRNALSKHIHVRPREDYDAVQRELREIRGVTAIIFDQQCAAEKRRERKRELQPIPRKRVYINESVCEGCGDCGTRSNCLSVIPVETDHGRKTRIHQNSCNFDYSCLEGDCPAFMTLTLAEGTQARPRAGAAAGLPEGLPDPPAYTGGDPTKIMLIGIGGTGVVTVDALLVTAALLDGKHALHLDQTGLSQKGGAVLSNFLVSDRPIEHANRIVSGEADLVLAFDLIASVSPDNLKRFSAERTRIVANTARASTAQVVTDVSAQMPTLDALRERLERYAIGEGSFWIDAEKACDTLFGSSAASNVFLLGAAYQQGAIPVAAASIEAAIRANDVAVEQNVAAFRWGRRSVCEPEALKTLSESAESSHVEGARERLQRHGPRHLETWERLLTEAPRQGDLDSLLPSRVADLLLFQGRRAAKHYLTFVERVAEDETARAPGRSGVAEAVARGLFKLTAVKDEYEVARLWLQDPTYEQVCSEFEGEVERHVLLHPPLLRRMGLRRKLRLGSWVMRLFRGLYALRVLRGTPLDLFGYTAHRRLQRSLPAWYRRQVEAALEAMSAENHTVVVDVATLPDQIRGYEEVLERNIDVAKLEAERLLEKLTTPTETTV